MPREGSTSLAKSDPLAGRVISERYRVVETLAPGPRDARYLARRLDTGALVEVRVLSGDLAPDDEVIRALRGQATRVAGAASPSPPIATVYECERTPDGALVLALEHPEGPTLRDTILRKGRLGPERALRLAILIGEALEWAHNLGLIHGGLCPENIVLVGPEPTVVLTQFGLDRLLASRSASTVARNGAAGKDAIYQAPEQASGETTERSDIYALGAVLFEMLAGTPPVPGTTSRRRLRLESWTTRRSEVTRSLERIIGRALQVAPDRRPPYMSVVCNELSDALNRHRQRTVPGHGAVAGRRTVHLVVLAGLIGTGVLAIWVANARMTPDTSPPPKPLPQSTLTAPAPAAPAPVATTTPGSDIAPGPGDAGRGMNLPRPDTPAASPAARGPSESSVETAARSTVPSARAPDLRDSQKPETTRPSVPRAVTPPRPADAKSVLRAGDRGEPAPPPPRTEDVTETQRPRAPAAPRPEPPRETREVGEDPGAIIDWLLKEGGRQQR